jgi:hypothetical protein
MNPDTQAIFFFVALAAFVVAGVLAFIQRAFVHALIAAGLAAFALVYFWNAVEAA